MACLLALVGHGVWFFWLDATTWAVPRDTTPPPPEWTFVQLYGDAPNRPLTDMLDVWSPAAIALPTPTGFSRPLLTEEIRLRPPLHSPSETVMLLERQRARPETHSAVTLPEWKELREQMDARPLRLPPAPVPEPDRPEFPPPVPQVTLLDGVDGRQTEQMALTENATAWGTAPWTAELLVRIDPWGVVNRVVVHQRSSHEPANEHVVREAYTWRWTPSEQADSARVRVVYYGVPPGEPPAREAP